MDLAYADIRSALLTNRSAGRNFGVGASETPTNTESGCRPDSMRQFSCPESVRGMSAMAGGRVIRRKPNNRAWKLTFGSFSGSDLPPPAWPSESRFGGALNACRKGIKMAATARSASALSVADINTSITNEPRIQDLALASRLGFTDPHKVRTLIARNADELASYGEVSATVAETSSAKGGRPGREYWLNEGQALLVCALSRTPQAAVVRKSLIDVFMAWRAGHLKPAATAAKQHNQDDVRAANRLAYDWSQRDFRRYQAWLHAHLQKLREAGWTDSADAALAQLSVDPLLIGRPASQGPLIGDEPVGVGAIHLPGGWLVFDSAISAGWRAGEQVLAVSPVGAVLTVTLADCWAGPDRYAQVPQYGPRTGWMPVPSTAGPSVRAARAVLVLGRVLSGRHAVAKAGAKA
jgi:hypothetical protein